MSTRMGNKNLIKLDRLMRFCPMNRNEKNMINISILLIHNHNLQAQSQILVLREIISNNIRKVIMRGLSINMNSLKGKEKCIQDIIRILKLKNRVKVRLMLMMIYSRQISGPNLFINKLNLL